MARPHRLFRSIFDRGPAPIPLLVISLLAVVSLLSSCTLLAHSPMLVNRTTIPLLAEDHALITSASGRVPYQKWRLRSWEDGMRYVWVVGHHDFRKYDQVELILYFHGMHSGDYYRLFRNELEELAASRPTKPFLFVGFVDTPYAASKLRSKNRWRSLVPQAGERPDPLFTAVNCLFKAFRKSFPNVKKNRTDLVMAGFSGGGRVLDSVGNWLAHSPKEDPYAKVFLSKLSKIVYFDCWFDPTVVETVPALLKSNPAMKIVGTVHMEKPKKHAALLAGRYKMRKLKKKDELVGAGGRLLIFSATSHWKAMISLLKEALDT